MTWLRIELTADEQRIVLAERESHPDASARRSHESTLQRTPGSSPAALRPAGLVRHRPAHRAVKS